MRTRSARSGLLALILATPAVSQNPAAPAPAAAVPAPVTAPGPAAAAPAWRPFQELGFLVGSWSGAAESGVRVGGRVARFTPEFSGNYLVHRGSTILTADDGKEETIDEVGYFAYDREKRRYVASYFFSTGISATFDVEVAAESARLVSRELLNAEPGTKARMLFARKADGELSLSTDLAPPGKDFVPWLVSGLKKK
ncbi:MAG: heme-binding beta-barrel domain-containing protein [Acidobacteriota bacterium]|nr:heme-binding beta-barrel domain-containing protein [Acidobacteriota bacterium]